MAFAFLKSLIYYYMYLEKRNLIKFLMSKICRKHWKSFRIVLRVRRVSARFIYLWKNMEMKFKSSFSNRLTGSIEHFGSQESIILLTGRILFKGKENCINLNANWKRFFFRENFNLLIWGTSKSIKISVFIFTELITDWRRKL